MASTERYLNQLIEDKKTLANNLVEKGVEATEDETFTELVPKVLTIPSADDITYIEGNEAEYFFYNNSTRLTNAGKFLKIMKNITSTNHMFNNCYNLSQNKIPIELLDLSKVETMEYMFSNMQHASVSNLIRKMDFSNVKSIANFGYSSYSTVNFGTSETPWHMNTVSCENFSRAFYSNSNGYRYGTIDCDSAINISQMFYNNKNLATFGGLLNLGKAYSVDEAENFTNYTLDLSSTKLNESSLINVLTNLYDIKTKGCNPQKCILGSTNLEKLTSEAGQEAVAQATAYGWTIA